MKTVDIFEKLGQLDMSKKEKQNQISMYEVANIWDFLVMRYDIIESTNILENFVKDEDLKLILQKGTKILTS